jgi:hypothetical protein
MGEYFDTFVKNVKPELVIAPKEFQITKIAPKDEYYTVVELDITRMPQGVIPGEIGKIIFK